MESEYNLADVAQQNLVGGSIMFILGKESTVVKVAGLEAVDGWRECRRRSAACDSVGGRYVHEWKAMA